MITFLRILALFIVTLVIDSAIALAQAGGYVQNPSLWEQFTASAPTFLVSLIPFLLGFMVLCRAVSEILLLFQDKIPGDWENGTVKVLRKIIEVLGKILGQIGVGMPNKMVAEKAEQIAQKKVEDG